MILIKINIDFKKMKEYNKKNRKGGKGMIEVVPEWMANLEDEDVVFIKKFLLASGSLK